jgi:putative oxygen-independent coproporphyrinogen III oxidase
MTPLRPMKPLPPLSLYVHLPWCVRKCPYCDFNSYTLQGELPEAAYVDALLRDLDGQRAAMAGRRLASVFFGGGTPSLFSGRAIARLLGALRVDLAPDAEITLEANPGAIEYRAAGVNRVSLGAQSFAAAQLTRLGRIHAATDTGHAVAELRTAGFGNFNLDLMFALPQQSVAEALADIDAALALEPPHLSHYQLTLEPGTVFGARPPAGLPEPDLAADVQQRCQERLAAAGFKQYEVSGYARDGHECRHNLNYWRFGDYLGIGAGAHGKCSRLDGARLVIERTWRTREPRRYLAQDAAAPVQRRTVEARELPFEFMLNALRLTRGFSQTEFEARTGLGWPAAAPVAHRLRARGLLVQAPAPALAGAEGPRWHATPLGFAFLNDVLTEFLPPRVAAESS